MKLLTVIFFFFCSVSHAQPTHTAPSVTSCYRAIDADGISDVSLRFPIMYSVVNPTDRPVGWVGSGRRVDNDRNFGGSNRASFNFSICLISVSSFNLSC